MRGLAPGSRRLLLGGRSDRYTAPAATPSGRAPRAPIVTDAAADGMLQTLRVAVERGEARSLLAALEAALTNPARCARLLRGVRARASAMATRNASEVLLWHAKCTAALPAPEQRRRRVHAILRKLRRRHAAPMPNLGVEALPPSAEDVFSLQLTPSPGDDARLVSCASATIARWQPERFGLTGIVAPARARAAVRKWREGTGSGPTALPPRHVLRVCFWRTHAPTALASSGDCWVWWPGGRRVSPAEMCLFFGMEPACGLARALCDSRTVAPTTAVGLLGRAVASGVAASITRRLLDEGALRPPLSYASGCSGIDGFFAGVAQATGGRVTYLHAAEKRADARRVLSVAHGLADENIYMDACGAAASTARRVDLYVATPDCSLLSRRNHERCDAAVADGATRAWATLGFLANRRADVAVLENVAGADVVEALSALARALSGYTWRAQTLCARKDCGLLMARERHFLVGCRTRRRSARAAPYPRPHAALPQPARAPSRRGGMVGKKQTGR